MIRTEVLGLAFAVSEGVLAWRRRAARSGAVRRDSGTLPLVWVVISASVAASLWVAGSCDLGRFRLGPAGQVGALLLFAAGISLRWWAIVVLGRFFTVDVAIHRDHRLVVRGPYAVLRHPSYTGLLAAFAGLGWTLASWPALGVLCLPVAAVLVRRIRVEERALAGRFGQEWAAHCARTWRLLPLVW